MLVLSRKVQESVVVGGCQGFERLFKVTVLEVRGGCVRLGIEVDAEVPVHRLEVWERIMRQGPPVAPRIERSRTVDAIEDADCSGEETLRFPSSGAAS